MIYYKNFGIYLWKNKNITFSIRCGVKNKLNSGVHYHYDNLSITCKDKNNKIIFDPGTNNYTNNLYNRNLYRSPFAHFAPIPKLIDISSFDELPNKFNLQYYSECLFFSDKEFLGYHIILNSSKIYRYIKIEDENILVYDFSDDNSEMHDCYQIAKKYNITENSIYNSN